jgi:peptidoglycan/LPS O-acetylase OafA/YrhL
MLARYWRATGLLKLQMRWLVAALAAIVVAIAIGLIILAVAGDDAVYAWIPAMLAYPLVPLAIGIAVLRYRLYEIDRLISRTIGWALVTAMLIGAFLLLVLASTELLQPLTGGNTLAVAGSTLIVVALFAPLRGRVQRAVDRRFDRARYDGERLLGAFGERLRDEVDLETVRNDFLATVDQAVRPASVGLWLREREGSGR